MGRQFQWIEPSEKEIEDAILEFLNYQVGCFAFKVKIKATYDAGGGYYRKLPKFMLAGTPDIIACYDGVFIGMEVKSPTGRQSKDQKDFQDLLQDKSKGFYCLVRSVKEAEEALKRVKTISPSGNR